jgi:hypothetical protein
MDGCGRRTKLPECTCPWDFFTLGWSSIQSIYYEAVKVPVKNLGKSGRQA